MAESEPEQDQSASGSAADQMSTCRLAMQLDMKEKLKFVVHFICCSILFFLMSYRYSIRYFNLFPNSDDIFRWRYTQFSQFNADSTLLLVSGVHTQYTSTNGECAVFSING